ncbi:MAG: hypothetical protein IPK19_12180 [Chloroflexi bacterium]|nr:hypothetical protein [Chloroflexota bacterium]
MSYLTFSRGARYTLRHCLEKGTIVTRTFALLDDVSVDTSTGILTMRGEAHDNFAPEISMRREGAQIVIAAGTGVIEVALRLRYDELRQALHTLQPNDGLTTSRQVGTGQAYLGIGLKTDESLVLRPVIVGDATGHLRLNFRLNATVRARFAQWIEACAEVK